MASDENQVSFPGFQYTREELMERAMDIVPEICTLLASPPSSVPDESPHPTEKDVIPLLQLMAEICKPKELLLALLEQSHCFKSSSTYVLLLFPIRRCLERLNGCAPLKVSNYSLIVTVESLYSHLAALELPRESTECVIDLKRNTTDVRPKMISDLSGAFLDFIEPFIKQSSSLSGYGNITEGNETNNEENRAIHRKHAESLTLLLIKVLDRPLAYVYLCINSTEIVNSNDTEIVSSNSMERVLPVVKSEENNCRLCAAKCVDLIAKLQPNFVKTIISLREEDENEKRRKKSAENWKNANMRDRETHASCDMDEPSQQIDEEDDVNDQFSVKDPLPELGLAVFAYLVFGEKISTGHIPQVYRPEFFFELNSPALVRLLEGPQSAIVHKGLILAHELLARIEQQSLNPDLVEQEDFRAFVSGIAIAMTSSTVKELAQMSVRLLRTLLKAFPTLGRRRLIEYLLATVRHFGLQGHVIMMLKDEINEALNRGQPFCDDFTGAALSRLFQTVFLVVSTATFLEQTDRILSALNLLRYLLIRDKSTDNRTGLWNIIPIIREKFLNPIDREMESTREAAITELRFLNAADFAGKGGNGQVKENNCEINVEVGGDAMQGLSDNDKKVGIRSTLISIDMMQSVIGRVKELIEINRLS